MPFDIDVFLSQLMDYTDPDKVQALSRAAMQFAPVGPQFVKAAEFLEHGQSRPDLLGPTPGAELGGAAVEEKTEQDRLIQEQKVYEIKAAADNARQAQLDELGSLVTDMPSEKLFKIRAEAQQRGRQGSLEYGKPPSDEDYEQAAARYGGGGGFTVAPDSPEIQQRADDNAAWLADQPIRDAQFALSPEQSRRDPRAAELASDRLVGLRATKVREREVANQETLVNAYAKGGKVPYAQVMQFQGAGIPVPHEMRGLSPEFAKARISQIVASAQKNVDEMNSNPMMMNDPKAQSTAKYLMYVISMANAYSDQIDQGTSPDDVLQTLIKIIEQDAVNSGAIDYWTSLRQPEQLTEGQ